MRRAARLALAQRLARADAVAAAQQAEAGAVDSTMDPQQFQAVLEAEGQETTVPVRVLVWQRQ